MEHLEHFGLSRDPFANETHVDLFFASEVHADCERRLKRGAQQGKGMCLVTGAPGSGKTMTIRHLFESLDESAFEPCLLVPVPGVSDGDWVLGRFAAQLGIEEIARERSELLAQVYEALVGVREEGRSTVLIIDEAQVLADGNALGELRGLLNLEYDERRLVTLILAGLPDLETALVAEPGMFERVEINVRMPEMDSEASVNYLNHRVRAVGGNPAIIESSATKRLIEHGQGNPRRINVLADNALFEAYIAGRLAATEADVDKAAAEFEMAYAPSASVPNLFSPGVTTDDAGTTQLIFQESVDEDEIPTGEHTP